MIDTPLEHTHIPTNGIRLHVVQAGPHDGPLVMLLHGYPEFWYGWRHQIPYLVEQGYRVWVPDQRGYNLSDKPKGVRAYTLDETSADVAGLIDASGREKVYLVGHDWGAATAWWTAMKYRERLGKLATLNAPHPIVSARTIGRHPEQTRKSWYMFYFQIPWLPEALMRPGNWSPAVQSWRSSSRPGTFSDAEVEEYRKAWSQPGAMTAMLNWYRAAIRARPATPPNPRISTPILIIWGAQDKFIIREAAQMSLEFCDDARLEYIEDATHWVQHEEPQRVNQLLGEFLAG